MYGCCREDVAPWSAARGARVLASPPAASASLLDELSDISGYQLGHETIDVCGVVVYDEPRLTGLKPRHDEHRRSRPRPMATRNSEPLLLTVSEAADRLGIGRSSAYDLVRTRQLPVMKVGGRIRVPSNALLRWIEEQTEYPDAGEDEAA